MIPFYRHIIAYRHLLLLLLGSLLTMAYGNTPPPGEQDSLAYAFRQDNLSRNHNLRFNQGFTLGRSVLQIQDVINYKVFSFENLQSETEQYSIEHRLRSDWTWGLHQGKSIRLESNQYQDHRTGLASSISNLALLAGWKQGHALAVFLGGRSVERYGLVERGWTTEIQARQQWQTDRQVIALQTSGVRDQLDQHLNHALDVKGNYQVHFGSAATYQTALTSSVHVQGFYTDSLGSSQTRDQTERQWQNQFKYRLGEHLHLFHQLVWQEQLTSIDQEKLSATGRRSLPGEDRLHYVLTNESGFMLVKPGYSARTAFKVEQAQNRYYIDYTQALYQLREDVMWQLPGSRDSLVWSTQLSRLKYDTPDSTNDDDRDELRFFSDFHLRWRPGPFYRLEAGTKVSLFHLIYLFDSRSSENHWNRNLLLWTGYDWQHARWGGSGQARVRSNYFDYDYDDLFLAQDQPTRSFVHRSLDIHDDLSYHFHGRWAVSAKLTAKWEDEGQLNWTAFVQQVSRERQQVEWVVKVFYDYQGWRGWLGGLTHRRTTTYTDSHRDQELWEGVGPVFGLRHRLSGRLYLHADARVIAVQDQGRDYVLPRIFFTLVYR